MQYHLDYGKLISQEEWEVLLNDLIKVIQKKYPSLRNIKSDNKMERGGARVIAKSNLIEVIHSHSYNIDSILLKISVETYYYGREGIAKYLIIVMSKKLPVLLKGEGYEVLSVSEI